MSAKACRRAACAPGPSTTATAKRSLPRALTSTAAIATNCVVCCIEGARQRKRSAPVDSKGMVSARGWGVSLCDTRTESWAFRQDIGAGMHLHAREQNAARAPSIPLDRHVARDSARSHCRVEHAPRQHLGECAARTPSCLRQRTDERSASGVLSSSEGRGGKGRGGSRLWRPRRERAAHSSAERA